MSEIMDSKTLKELYETFLLHPHISTDSRKIEPGSLFFALHGEHFDGNQFAATALDNGAILAVVDNPKVIPIIDPEPCSCGHHHHDHALYDEEDEQESYICDSHDDTHNDDENKPKRDPRYILVPDTLKALQALAAYHRHELGVMILAITGSNGKTTTTSLIYHIFKAAGIDAGLAGNIGNSLALQVAEEPHKYYIIELSSFQLDNMYKFRANIAILLNITPDHLDRYDFCMQNYVDAKMRITQNQTEEDSFIYWNDDPIVKKEIEKYNLKSRICPFAENKEEGCVGYIEDGLYKLDYPTPFAMPEAELSLTGKHNIYNSLAAGLACHIAGIDEATIRKSLGDFPGVEHRLEKVCKVNGVQYINDSKATNVDACWYALESMKTPTILILGGKDKGNDYSHITELVKQKCVGLVYLGADNKKLHDNFDSLGIPVCDTHSMKDCIAACHKMAKEGDTVLLSPCCASFDLFKNMEDRGEQFKTLARQL